MSVTRSGNTVFLNGHCRVEDAEALAGYLQSGANTLDLSACRGLHAAVFQAILAFSPVLLGAERAPEPLQPLWRTLPQGQAGAGQADRD